MKLIKQVDVRLPSGREELIEKAVSLEEECVSVGGLAHELGMIRGCVQEAPRVFGRLIEYARRVKGLSVESLATLADIDLAEVVAIEREETETPSTRTVFQLANALGLSARKLLELTGLTESRDRGVLSEAAIRFAARSEPTTKLSKAEREAFEEFVKVLTEASDGG